METDYAWAAGFFDGEGTTSVLAAKRDRHEYVRMSIAQKDNSTLERFRNIFNLGRIYKSKTRDIYNWNNYKKEDVITVLNKMWPYLSEIKKIQALRCFNRIDNIYGA